MDQEKIGRFLAELRKEQGMTQQQLADAIGVSNKTISKWECGKGMPELSSIIPLCQTLHINVNELLSGERLPEDGYSKKAEENMMSLIQETENTKRNSNSRMILIITVIAIVLCVGYMILTNMGLSMGLWFLDYPTATILLVMAVLFLLATGLGRPFLQSFRMVTGRQREITESELCLAKAAVKLVSSTLLWVGLLESCIGLITIMLNYSPTFDADAMCVSISVALLGPLYGILGVLLLLPIRMRLEAMQPVRNV